MPWLLLACAGAPAVDEAPPDSVPEGWTLGAPVVCDAPLAEPAWSEVLLPAWANPAPSDEEGGGEPGAVAWIERPEGRWLASAAEPDGIRLTLAETGEERTLPTEAIVEALASGDFDGDGTLDLVAGGPDVTIWFSFGESSEELRRVRPPRSNGTGVHDAVPIDADADGDLDLALVHTGAEATNLAYALLRNDGSGTFAEEPFPEAEGVWGYGFDALAWDVDADGDPDLLTCNDKGHDLVGNGLLLNDGAGGFHPAEDPLGLDVTVSCMGLALGDADQDGRLDVYVADAFDNILLERLDDAFYDTATARGLPPFTRTRMAWGNAVVDLDNDGRTDLVANLGDAWHPRSEPVAAAAYFQAEDGSFAEAAPFAHAGVGRGMVVADHNGDGVPDVLLGQAAGSPRLFASTGCTADHWLEVEAPSGTEIVVEAGGRVLAAFASREHAMGSTGPSRAHFGLGPEATVDRVTARPPWRADPVVLEGPFAADRRVRYVE